MYLTLSLSSTEGVTNIGLMNKIAKRLDEDQDII